MVFIFLTKYYIIICIFVYIYKPFKSFIYTIYKTCKNHTCHLENKNNLKAERRLLEAGERIREEEGTSAACSPIDPSTKQYRLSSVMTIDYPAEHDGKTLFCKFHTHET